MEQLDPLLQTAKKPVLFANNLLLFSRVAELSTFSQLWKKPLWFKVLCAIVQSQQMPGLKFYASAQARHEHGARRGEGIWNKYFASFSPDEPLFAVVILREIA